MEVAKPLQVREEANSLGVFGVKDEVKEEEEANDEFGAEDMLAWLEVALDYLIVFYPTDVLVRDAIAKLGEVSNMRDVYNLACSKAQTADILNLWDAIWGNHLK